MKKCDKCGEEIEETAIKCSKCGSWQEGIGGLRTGVFLFAGSTVLAMFLLFFVSANVSGGIEIFCRGYNCIRLHPAELSVLGYAIISFIICGIYEYKLYKKKRGIRQRESSDSQ